MSAAAITAHAYFEHFGAVLNIKTFIKKEPVKRPDGAIQCAELVKALANAPRTQPNNWKKGMALTSAVVESLAIGTPIASGWNAENFYPNGSTGQHSGFYSGVVKDKSGVVIGFTNVEQYRGVAEIKEREVYFDPKAHGKPDTYFYNGGSYATIQW
ncbi:hypothetical protein SAMN05216359_102372 [Roseateles sp. YR242]|uniref:BPSL0067 family protein n=1 Tax=Roseateles sp. YR242 TaxID=1855305 RepID=UPI0008D20D8C|nr:BPSL0067 family protein [Roseateles sp. YR242]SEK60725.1 hypothetical protein SAMN05216359_102372 [Roseateles sp. YR242]